MSGVQEDCDVLRAGIPSYIVYLIVPIILICVGIGASQKVAFGTTEYIVFFAIPLTAGALGAIKLLLCRALFCNARIVLERFSMAKLRYEEFAINVADIVFSSASNNIRDKLAVKRRSGLVVVPLSVFYVEYTEHGEIRKVAFDVAPLDNRRLLAHLRKYPCINVEGYYLRPKVR